MVETASGLRERRVMLGSAVCCGLYPICPGFASGSWITRSGSSAYHIAPLGALVLGG
jgi:hypothetical protein